MINTIVNLQEIDFEEKQPGDELLESIRIRGVAIAVRVNRTETGYICVDGRKRLTACRILGQEDQKYLRVPVMLMNDFSKSGSAFWGNTQNHH